MREPSPQLVELLAECSPEVMSLALGVRELVLTEAPEAEEILCSVYAEVIVFRIPGRKRGAFCNFAAYANHVNLVFYYGAGLSDPHGLLRGSGRQMRHIRFKSPNDLRRRYLRNYIRASIWRCVGAGQILSRHAHTGDGIGCSPGSVGNDKG